ncbi:hypothetical protein AMECASPLE_020251 [Ameca splendens]|uniref:Uncharacterized protein n=1 Tax=Ameca splendens TaxID=208324 RepID=A0ABV0ZCZ3_9TELE
MGYSNNSTLPVIPNSDSQINDSAPPSRHVLGARPKNQETCYLTGRSRQLNRSEWPELQRKTPFPLGKGDFDSELLSQQLIGVRQLEFPFKIDLPHYRMKNRKMIHLLRTIKGMRTIFILNSLVPSYQRSSFGEEPSDQGP